jgi:lipoprotein-anchoring transpeptidase ErfK/SrfK
MLGNRLHWVAAIGIALAMLSAGCHAPSHPATPGPSAPSIGPSASTEPSAAPARIRIRPAAGRTAVDPGGGISVTATGGTLQSVVVRTSGEPVEGRMDAAGASWHSVWALDTDTRYTVVATAVDASGTVVKSTSSFRTLAPGRSFRTTIFEGYRKTYGVGMPIILTFDTPIVNREAVERALEVTSSTPVVGAWYWDGPTTLYFRPRSYWPAHTTVTFTGHLDGVEGAPGVYGVHTLTQTFTIGRSLVTVASTTTHRVKVYLDRKLFGDWPMSSGKPGDDTPNGTYLSIEKTNPEHMVGPGYDLMVPYSVRFTWSGDFLHDAYWSVNQQGFENVSHGCINLSPANAKTYYGLSVPGDPVTVSGSPKGGTWGNGWTVWFLSWTELLKGSATGQAVQVGTTASAFVDPEWVPAAQTKAPLGEPRPKNAKAA